MNKEVCKTFKPAFEDKFIKRCRDIITWEPTNEKGMAELAGMLQIYMKDLLTRLDQTELKIQQIFMLLNTRKVPITGGPDVVRQVEKLINKLAETKAENEILKACKIEDV